MYVLRGGLCPLMLHPEYIDHLLVYRFRQQIDARDAARHLDAPVTNDYAFRPVVSRVSASSSVLAVVR